MQLFPTAQATTGKSLENYIAVTGYIHYLNNRK